MKLHFSLSKLTLALVMVLLCGLVANAQKIPFQGQLLENGEPVNGPTTLVFSFDDPTWTETHENVQVTNGLYSLVLGSIADLPSGLFDGAESLSLNISVDGTALTPVEIYAPIATAVVLPDTVRRSFVSADPLGTTLTVIAEGEGGADNIAFSAVARSANGGNTGIWGRAESETDHDNQMWGIFGESVGNSTAFTYGVLGESRGDGTGVRYGVRGNVFGANSDLTIAVRGMNSSEGVQDGSSFGAWFDTRGVGATGMTNYGVRGLATKDAGRNIGVHGKAQNGDENYAGWFDGDVQINADQMGLGKKDWETNPHRPYFVFRGTSEETVSDPNNTDCDDPDTPEFEACTFFPDLIWMEVQDDGEGNEMGAITLRSTDGKEFSVDANGISDAPSQNLSINDPDDNQVLSAYAVGHNDDDDDNTPDVGPYAGEMILWGNNGTPNVQMGAPTWEGGNAAGRSYLTLYGNTEDGGGWYRSFVNARVDDDGNGAEWGVLDLTSTDDNYVSMDGSGSISLSQNIRLGDYHGGGGGIWGSLDDTGDDGNGNPTDKVGGIYLRSTDGAEFGINAYGIAGALNDLNVGNSLNISSDEQSRVSFQANNDNGVRWGRVSVNSPSDFDNIFMDYKTWETNPELPYFRMNGAEELTGDPCDHDDDPNTPDQPCNFRPDLVWMEVYQDDDGNGNPIGPEMGRLTLNSSDGNSFTIDANGLDGDIAASKADDQFSVDVDGQGRVFLQANNDNGTRWGRISVNSPSDFDNIFMDYKTWETNPELPYFRMNGAEELTGDPCDHDDDPNTPDQPCNFRPELVWMEVYQDDDGNGNPIGPEMGRLTLNSSDGNSFTIDANGLSGDITASKADDQFSVDVDGQGRVFLEANNDNGTRWGRISINSPSDLDNIFLDYKTWETNPNLPYFRMNGEKEVPSGNCDHDNDPGTPDIPCTSRPDLVWMDVSEAGAEEIGSINFRGTDGSEFGMNAYGFTGGLGDFRVNNFASVGDVSDNAIQIDQQSMYFFRGGDGSDNGTHVMRIYSEGGPNHYGRINLYDTDRTTSVNITGDGNISATGTVSATTLTQSSDQRLKTNILPLNNALDNLLAMRGVSYNWLDKNNSQANQIGVIAQEVEEVYPEFVHTNDEGMKSVNYSQMVAVLIEAIKELNTKITSLKTENASLKASLTEVDGLKSQMKNLETLVAKLIQNDAVTTTTEQQH